MTKKLKAAVHIFEVRQSQLKIWPQLKLVKISGDDFLTSSTIKIFFFFDIAFIVQSKYCDFFNSC